MDFSSLEPNILIVIFALSKFYFSLFTLENIIWKTCVLAV